MPTASIQRVKRVKKSGECQGDIDGVGGGLCMGVIVSTTKYRDLSESFTGAGSVRAQTALRTLRRVYSEDLFMYPVCIYNIQSRSTGGWPNDTLSVSST